MPDGGREDYRSLESESAPIPNRDLLLRSLFLPALPGRTGERGSRPPPWDAEIMRHLVQWRHGLDVAQLMTDRRFNESQDVDVRCEVSMR